MRRVRGAEKESDRGEKHVPQGAFTPRIQNVGSVCSFSSVTSVIPVRRRDFLKQP